VIWIEVKILLGLGERQNGWTLGEILPTHDYCNRGVRWRGSIPRFSSSKLVVPPLQLGVVGPYPMWGV
jgi:hypothetical protein